jgi:hypothetical protein
VYVQALAFLQKQDAGSSELFAEGSDSELGMDSVGCIPLLIADPVGFLEDNFSIDSN